MNIQIHVIVSLCLFCVAEQIPKEVNWEVRHCPADNFKLEIFTTNRIFVKSNHTDFCQKTRRPIVMKIRVTSENEEAVKLGRPPNSRYSGDTIISDDSMLDNKYNLDQMKLFACVEYKVHVDLVARTCNKERKFKCNDKEKLIDRVLDSTEITAFLNDVYPIESAFYFLGLHGNNTRFYLLLKPEMHFCNPVYNFTVYSTSTSGSEMVYGTVLSKSDYTVDVPNLHEGMEYSVFTNFEADNASGVKFINPEYRRFILNKYKNDADLNMTDLHIESSGATWVSLAWQPPSLPLSVESYFFQLYSENSTLLKSKMLAKDSTTINVTDTLKPCSTYRVDFIIIRQDDYPTSSINVTVTTGGVAPGEVQNLQVEIDDLEFIATWEPPVHGKECVSNYILYNKALNASEHGGLISNTSVIIMSPNTTGRLRDLAACIDYSVTVKAITHEERLEGKNVSINRVTPPHVLPAPDQGEVVEIFTKGVTLSWRVAYTIKNQCSMDKLMVHCYNKAGKVFEFVSSERNPNGTVIVQCLGLEPFTGYSCKAVAVNSAGKSNASLSIEFVTLQDVPSSPLSVKLEGKTSNSIVISWDKPEMIPGILTNYTVRISCLGASYSVPDDCKQMCLESVRNLTIPCSETAVTLDNLQPFFQYNVSVMAATEAGYGDYSPEIRVLTLPNVLPAPDQGEVVEIFTKGVTLSWRVAYTIKNQCSMDKLIVHCYNKAGKVFEFASSERNPNGTVIVQCLGLEPFTGYSCKAVAVNSAGESNASLSIEFVTLQDVPSSPLSVKLEGKTSNSIVISWDKPEMIPGILTNYTVRISCLGASYSVPDDCKQMCPESVRNLTVPCSETAVTLDNLQPFFQYNVSVTAATEAGYGDYSPEIRVLTLSNVSDVVRNVTINVHYNESVVTWRPPCISNGVIANFALKLTGSRNGFGPVPSRHWYISRDRNWEYLRNLVPETTYELSISALVEDVFEENPLTTPFTSSAKIPRVPTKLTQEFVEVDPKLSSRPSCEAEVLIKQSFFNRDNGEIRYLSLLVAEDHMLTAARSGIILNKTWPHMTTWAVATSSQHTIMYQATPIWWNPLEGSETGVIRYTLGRETCSDMDIHAYCNGPLSANTLYAMRIRVFTSAGFRDSPPIWFKTDVGSPYNLIMSLFLGLFVVTSLVIIVAYLVFGKRQWKSGKAEHKYLEELPAKKLLAHTNVVLEHNNLMHSEFLHLTVISDTLDITSDEAKLSINMPKNRYINILPYDFNRVIIEGEDQSDYINASFITDETLRNKVEYVACQAPKDNTVHDFWRMIVQCGVRAIVMLCNLREKNKEKCHWYFPEEGETLEFGDISVHCSKKIANESFIQRVFVINMPNQDEMKINHYHFVDWPDFEAPAEAIPMIKLCQAVRADIGMATIAVHCSAGVGRTGTYIAVDMILRHLNHRKKVSVFRTVLKLRGQRANMVQNEAQYAYIYKVLKHTLDNHTLFFRKGSELLLSSRSNSSSSLDGHSLLSFPLKVRS